MKQLPNTKALSEVEAIAGSIAEMIEFLQSDVAPDVPDVRVEGEDDYHPSMHNDLPGGGARFPDLDRRWLAIGVTDLQRGLMALRRAAGEGNGRF